MDKGLIELLSALDVPLSVFSFVIGACIASFLNVVIWRVPRGESIVSPPSHCPKCNAAIRWYQNLPIISWLALRGKCANCRAPISPRYIIVETVGALLFLAAFRQFGIFAPVMWIWLSLMIVGTMIDFDHQLLPDFVTIGGMVLGIVMALGLQLLTNEPWSATCTVAMSLYGLGFGFSLLWLVRFFGSKVFKREAMGLGDVFLMGAIGAISGPVAVLFVLVFSSLFGSIVGVMLIALSKTRLGKFTEIPFGPYICAAHLLFIFYGRQIITWYLG